MTTRRIQRRRAVPKDYTFAGPVTTIKVDGTAKVERPRGFMAKHPYTCMVCGQRISAGSLVWCPVPRKAAHAGCMPE